MATPLAAVAQTGFSNATAYDTHRPSYPPESIEHLLKQLEVLGVEGARILDIGAGTGKFTSILASRPEKYDIIAIEPHADMRKVLEGKALNGVKVLDGVADAMPAVEDDWADAVVCTQSFHWFANMPALKEIHRTVMPGGVLGLIWNIEDYNARVDYEPTTAWLGRLKDVIWSQRTDTDPRFRHNEWPKVFDEQLKSTPASIFSADPLFSLPLGEHVVKWTTWLSKEAVWLRFSTISQVANLKGAELDDAKRRAFEAMEGDDVETNEKGEVAVHGQTMSYWTSAIPSTTLKSGG